MIRARVPRKWPRILATLAGTAIIAADLAADALAIDPDGRWGASRTALLLAGLLVIAVANVPFLVRVLAWGASAGLNLRAALGRTPVGTTTRNVFEQFVRPVLRGIAEAVEDVRRSFGRSRLIRWASERAIVRSAAASRDRQATSLVLGGVGIVVLVYIWIVSVGFWTDWPSTSDYYALLGDAFLAGRTDLLIDPPGGLAELGDPYDLEARGNLPILWDASYYRGRYFLYWGPTPGIVAALIRVAFGVAAEDNHLVFIFMAGWIASTGLLLYRIYRNHFSTLPPPVVFLAVAIVGLANPLPWLLSRPEVYEAAIASGQFFLSLGLYLGYLAWESRASRVWASSIAGLALAAAVASRLTLVPAIGFLAAASVVCVGRRAGGVGARRATLRTAVAISTPLLLGILALGWYNYVRFGSAFDPGHRYALTRANLHMDYSGVFSPGNVSVNIFNYGLNPPRTLTVFPFVKPTWGRGGLGPITRLVPPSPIYQVEQVNGLAPTFPFLLFAFVPLVAVLRRRGRATLAGAEGTRLAVVVLLGGLLALAPLLLFNAASMRYLADAVPLLAIAAVLGWWNAWPRERDGPARRALYGAGSGLLACLSIAMGFLLAVTGYYARFETLNLELFEAITRFLAR